MHDIARMSMDSRVVRVASTVDAEVDGEIVALKIDTGAFYGLNLIGARIWKLIAEPIDIGAVCARLVSEYAVEPALCEMQVLELLEALRAESLVTVTTLPSDSEA